MKTALVISDSKFILDDIIQKYTKTIKNIITYYYPENSIQDILEEASYVSLFQDEKIVIVKNATFFGKDKISEEDTNALIQYFMHPYPCTTLIFTSYEAADKRKSITKAIIENGVYQESMSPKNYELYDATRDLIKNYHVNDQVVKYIVDACLGRYDIIRNEIQKLDLYFKKGSQIEFKDIQNIIASNSNDNIFKFVDAVMDKNMASAYHLLNDFRTLKIDELQVLNLLIREYHFIYYYKICERKGMNRRDVLDELKIQDWQLSKIQKESSRIPLDD